MKTLLTISLLLFSMVVFGQKKQKPVNVLFTVRFNGSQDYRQVHLWYASLPDRNGKKDNVLKWAKLRWIDKNTLVCIGDTVNEPNKSPHNRIISRP